MCLWCVVRACAHARHTDDTLQKGLGVHNVRKIWFPPPPKRAQNEEKLYKSVENLENVTLLRGGVGKRNLMDKTMLWTSGCF